MKKILDLVIIVLTVFVSIELIFIADQVCKFSPEGTRTVTFLTYIKDEAYADCVEYYYKNEALHIVPDEDMQECYGVAKYYEAALHRQISLKKEDIRQAEIDAENMQQAYEHMGELAPVRDRIDEVVEN